MQPAFQSRDVHGVTRPVQRGQQLLLDVVVADRRDAGDGRPREQRHARGLIAIGDAHDARQTLLHLDHRQDWSRWLNAAGVEDADLTRGPVLNQASMVIDAAVNGQGIALARTGLAASDLISGRLVRPFSLALQVSYAYWIVCPKATAELPKIVTFRSWLLDEAAEDMRRLSDIPPLDQS